MHDGHEEQHNCAVAVNVWDGCVRVRQLAQSSLATELCFMSVDSRSTEQRYWSAESLILIHVVTLHGVRHADVEKNVPLRAMNAYTGSNTLLVPNLGDSCR